jgi:hypothetical protein
VCGEEFDAYFLASDLITWRDFPYPAKSGFQLEGELDTLLRTDVVAARIQPFLVIENQYEGTLGRGDHLDGVLGTPVTTFILEAWEEGHD